MMKSKKLVVLCTMLMAFLYSACTHTEIMHSVLESSPYIDHSINNSATYVSGETGLALFMDGYYDHITADPDTTIDVFNGQVGFRGRFKDIGDAGFTLNATFEDELYGYGVMDIKFVLLNDKVSFYPDIGFGTGVGPVAWTFDARTSMVVDIELMKDVVSVYAAPRVIGLIYPYEEEISGGITVSYSYAMIPLYGINAGMTFTVPVTRDQTNLLITPNINYLMGREPKGDQADVSVFQVGCAVGISF